MRKLFIRSSAAVAGACAVLACGFALSAPPSTENRDAASERKENQPGEQRSTAATGDRDSAGHMDHLIANCLRGMSQGEVELGNFSLKHTQNQEVRQFAEMMVKDHENFNKQLERFTSASGARGSNASGERDAASASAADQGSRDTNSRDTTTKNDSSENSGQSAGQLIQVQKEVGEQIVSSIEKQLGQFQGADFDRAYLGQQFWGHVVFIANAKAAEKHASGELKQAISEGSQTAEKHLEECRRLIRDLSANVARSNAGTEAQPRR